MSMLRNLVQRWVSRMHTVLHRDRRGQSAGMVLGGLCAYTGGLHAFLLPLIGQHFFAQATTWQAMFYTYVMLSASFVLYPLGSLVFGTIGDRFSRIVALRICVTLILGAAFVIGCIPAAAQLGAWSVAVLGICVAAHTFGGGGEFSGSALLSIERAPAGHEGITSGLICVFAVVGILTASLVVTMMTPAAWRWAFWSCAPLLGIASLCLRQHHHDDYNGYASSNVNAVSFFDVIRQQPKAMIAALCWIGLFSVAYYFPFVFLHSFVPLLGRVAQADMALLNTCALLAYMLGLGVSGWWGDFRRERRAMMMGLVLLASIVYPALCLIVAARSVAMVGVAHAALGFAAGLFVGPIHAAVAALFPVAVRYRCMALCSTIAFTIMGGSTPWICMLMWQHEQSPLALASWMWTGCLLALLGFALRPQDLRLPLSSK